MTVSSTDRTAGPYIGTGVEVSFAFSFRIFTETDVVVVRTTAAGDPTTLARGTDYSVAVNADQNAQPGGTVTLVTPLAAGWTIDLTSDVQPLQGARLTNAGGFLPRVIEDALDRAMVVIQQQQVQVDRSVRVTESGGLSALPIASQRASRMVSFGTTGGATVTPFTVDQVAAVVSAAQITGVADGRLSTRTDAPIVMANGQTTVTVPGGFVPNVGALTVFQDGGLARGYTENGDGTITFATPFFGGEELEFIVGRLTAGNTPNFLTPEQFGADTTGATDSTAALADLFSVSKRVQLTPGATYRFSSLNIPAGTEFRARGATLRSDGSLTGTAVTVTFGDGVAFDEVVITSPGTETNENIVQLGVGVRGAVLEVRADAQRANGGIICTGQDVKIGVVRTVNIDRPLHLFNQSIVAQTTGSCIGFLDVTGYVRAFRADFCSFTLGGLFARGRSVNASKTPGHNGVLIQGCANWFMGDWFVDGAGEHAFRIGGSPGTYAKTRDFQVGDGFVVGCGGCALKINPSLLASPGVTETCDRGSFGYITGVDVGDGSLAGNEELLRITHGRAITIAGAYATRRDQVVSGQYALQLNDTDGLRIGELGGDALNSGFINFLGTSDVDGVTTFGGNVRNVLIDRLVGSSGGSNAIGVDLGSFNAAQVYICDLFLTGYSTNLLRWISGTINGDFVVAGRVYGSVPPTINGAPASPSLMVDVRYGLLSSRGRADMLRGATSIMELTTPSLDPSNTSPKGVYLNCLEGTPGADAYGSPIEFSRIGSTRRGAAIAPMQTGPNQEDVGIALLSGSSTTSSDALTRRAFIDHTGVLWIPDGVAAPTARPGWTAVYVDAADGDAKLVFGNGFVRTFGADS